MSADAESDPRTPALHSAGSVNSLPGDSLAGDSLAGDSLPGDSLPGDSLAELRQIVEDCFCDTPVGSVGLPHRGFINFKRVYGEPKAFSRVIEILALHVPPMPLAAADPGISPLVGALAVRLGVPSVYIRSVPKERHLSYGSEPSENLPGLFGERLESGTEVCLIDDAVATGSRLAQSVQQLLEAGLVPALALIIYDVNGNGDSLRRTEAAGALEARSLLVVHPNELAGRGPGSKR